LTTPRASILAILSSYLTRLFGAVLDQPYAPDFSLFLSCYQRVHKLADETSSIPRSPPSLGSSSSTPLDDVNVTRYIFHRGPYAPRPTSTINMQITTYISAFLLSLKSRFYLPAASGKSVSSIVINPPNKHLIRRLKTPHLSRYTTPPLSTVSSSHCSFHGFFLGRTFYFKFNKS
jgi:hypothetical protein